MKKILLQVAMLLFLSLVLALTYNFISPQGIALFARPSLAQQEAGSFPRVSLEEVYKIYQRPEVVLLDARSQVEYQYGHIAGALNLPNDNFEKKFPELSARLAGKKEIIIYCSGEGCDLSEHVAKKLKEKGYRNLKLFVGGWPAWLQAGYPIAH